MLTTVRCRSGSRPISSTTSAPRSVASACGMAPSHDTVKSSSAGSSTTTSLRWRR